MILNLLDLSVTSVVMGDAAGPTVTAAALVLVGRSLHRSIPENVKLYIISVLSVTVCFIEGRVTPTTHCSYLYNISTHILPFSAALMSTVNSISLSWHYLIS